MTQIDKQQIQTLLNDRRVGVALGAGGARGFAHIEILKLLDEMGITPSVISGSSMGGMIAAVYASGYSGQEIEDYCNSLLKRRIDLAIKIFGKNPSKHGSFWNPFKHALIDPVSLLSVLLPEKTAKDFSDTKIPLKLMTADLTTQKAHLIKEGAILPAVAATAALPTIFKPVVIDKHMLIDGGFVDPLPYGAIKDECDFVIAVDVTGNVEFTKERHPGTINTLIASANILMRSIIDQARTIDEPDFYVNPDVGHYQVLDIFKLGDILKATEPARTRLKQEIIDKLSE